MASESISQYIARLPDTSSGGGSLRRAGSDRIAGRFRDVELTSAFQPVFHPDGAVFGDSALVRCPGEGAAGPTPLTLFSLAGDDGDLVRLDRLCRTVHAINYFARAPGERALILKVDPRLLISVPDQHGRAFERVLTSLGVPTDRVIIEIPPAANANPALVSHVVANYHFRRYRVAVHYDGDAGWHATLNHLRAAFLIASFAEAGAGSLHAAMAAARVSGARLIVTRLETGSALVAAQNVGADLLQGYALGKPGAELAHPSRSNFGPDRTAPVSRR